MSVPNIQKRESVLSDFYLSGINESDLLSGLNLSMHIFLSIKASFDWFFVLKSIFKTKNHKIYLIDNQQSECGWIWDICGYFEKYACFYNLSTCFLKF